MYLPAAGGRPYVVINMVATIDGKIITGERGEPVNDLGSDVDHLMMRRIQNSVDAVLIGANNQRTTPKIWYPTEMVRIVVTRSGNVLYPSRFFDDAPEKAIVFCTEKSKLPALPSETTIVVLGREAINWNDGLAYLLENGVEKLLVEGGSEVNAQLLSQELVDE